ncbi:DUF1003 domain-containing protein [Variovorax sp. UMC13]|uniref:DUF1003 domain-containing protein n=1 Tax=Variovorax sp. UMC13 TaxID=1862326 RepID=UPI0016002336|nr:DUF1003 domain-containing protein [Variovorax sp. UMC13]MBB1600456.1 hypothetical protein [Variovorax sp. UMC13]
MAAAESARGAHGGGVTPIVERNIAALVERRRQDYDATSAHDKIADVVTGFAGSLKFVYLHLVIYGAWIVINLGWVPGVTRFDPTFVVLAMVASVEAIFISTFVLVSQNRMAAQSERRAELDLQISLLSEHEITRLIELVTEMGQRMGVEAADRRELQELAAEVQPEAVLDRLKASESGRAGG